MAHFSDALHIDTCAGKYCKAMLKRSEMTKNPDGRGWYCERCYGIWVKKTPKPNTLF